MRKKSTGKAQKAKQDRAIGPLVVSKANPRYFTVLTENGSEQSAIYLTGSHIWNNFHDGMGPGPDCSEHRNKNF